MLSLPLRRPRRVLAAALALAAVAAVFGAPAPGLLGRGSNDFAAAGSESVRAERAVEDASGLSATPQVLVLVRRPSPAKLRAAAAAIRAEPAFPRLAPPLRSRDGGEALVAAYAGADLSADAWRDAAARVERRLAGRPDVVVGGTALATRRVNERVQDDLTRAETIAFPILFVLALFVFRGVVAALLPILCGALAIVGALLMLRLLDLLTPVSSYALNIVTGAGLGLGIDYSLLLVSRYREELERLGPGADAVRETLRTAGRTVAYSAVTVAAAIATLAVFPLGFLRSMGIAGALVAPLAGAISLTVLPALFVLLGPRVDALFVRRARVPERGGWYRLAHGIMRRPLPVALASAALLVALGIPFASIRFTGVDATVLPAGAPSRVVEEASRRDFPAGATAAAFAVVRGDPDAYAARARALPETGAVLPPRRLGPDTWEVPVSSGRGFLDEPPRSSTRSTRSAHGCRSRSG